MRPCSSRGQPRTRVVGYSILLDPLLETPRHRPGSCVVGGVTPPSPRCPPTPTDGNTMNASNANSDAMTVCAQIALLGTVCLFTLAIAEGASGRVRIRNQSSEGEVVDHGDEQEEHGQQDGDDRAQPVGQRGADRGRQRSHLSRLPVGCGHRHHHRPRGRAIITIIRRPDRDQTGEAIVRPSSARLRELEDDGIIAEQRGQLRSVARIDRVSLLGDVTTTWPQNS